MEDLFCLVNSCHVILHLIIPFILYVHKNNGLGQNFTTHPHTKYCVLRDLIQNVLKSIRWYNKRTTFEVNSSIIYKYIHNIWAAPVPSGSSPGGTLLSGASAVLWRYCCCWHDNHNLVDDMASLLKEPLFEISAQGPAPNKDFYQLSITKSDVSYVLSCTTSNVRLLVLQ